MNGHNQGFEGELFLATLFKRVRQLCLNGGETVNEYIGCDSNESR